MLYLSTLDSTHQTGLVLVSKWHTVIKEMLIVVKTLSCLIHVCPLNVIVHLSSAPAVSFKGYDLVSCCAIRINCWAMNSLMP